MRLITRVGRPPQDRMARAHRILDVTAEMVLRWGYDKTTIDDVARGARVAKGTIYLHWRTRDDLFAALLRRERVCLIQTVRAGAPATLGELVGALVGAALGRPLLRAVLLGDSEVLGKLARARRSGATGLPVGGAVEAYLRRLAEHGALRPDASDHAMVITAIVYGFVSLPDLLPGAARVPDERIAALVADTIERVLGTGHPLSGEDAPAVAQATVDFLDALAEAAGDRLAAGMDTKERVP